MLFFHKILKVSSLNFNIEMRITTHIVRILFTTILPISSILSLLKNVNHDFFLISWFGDNGYHFFKESEVKTWKIHYDIAFLKKLGKNLSLLHFKRFKGGG